MTAAPTPGTEGLLRELTPQVLGALVRRYGHFDLAEDAVQEAVLAAVTQWPASGLPDNPRAWLITVASRRLTDLLRAEQARRRREDREAALRLPGEWLGTSFEESATYDDSIHVLLLCCHPTLTTSSQIALTLRAVGGLSTSEIARAFLVSEPTMTRRITRAKAQIVRAGARFTLGPNEHWTTRLAATLRVLYLIFTEGYAATTGTSLGRPDLTAEAIRLARIVHRLLPDESEAAGLLALMLLTEARRPARTGPDGSLIPMEDQDRRRWDDELIAEGIALVEAALPQGPVGPYQLQAAIAACHAEASDLDTTDWSQIIALYDLLLELDDNPVVRLNRIVAVAMRYGPQLGLAAIEESQLDEQLPFDHRLHSVRGQLLERMGRDQDAVEAYARAAARTTSLPHARYLNDRIRQVQQRMSDSGR